MSDYVKYQCDYEFLFLGSY